MVGDTLAHYRILEKLGEGGMGTVYKAEDTKLKRTVAIKIPPPEMLATEDDKRRFFQEAQAAAALDHPSICTIYEVNEADGFTFISMAYCEGHDLKALIEEDPFEVDAALDIVIQIAEGLGVAHAKGIVHRDVKTANIMVTEYGRAKILDFGIAKLIERPQADKDKQTMGTIAYMSPEQTKGTNVDQQTDIWSLGVVMYEMLTSLLPFQGEYEPSLVYSIVNEDPPPVSTLRANVPAGLERIIMTCLAKSAKHRYQNAGDLLADLRQLKTEIGPQQVLPQPRSRPGRPRSHVWSITVSTVLFVVIVAVVVGMFFRNGKHTAVSAQIPIAVVDFVNETGEPDLDGLSGMLITSLEQSRLRSVLTRSRMFDVLEGMGRHNVERIDETLGWEICRQANINVLVAASIRKFDELYTIDLKAYDLSTRDHLVTIKEEGRGRASIPSMIDEIARRMRSGLNENTSAIAANSDNVADIMTPNLEAFQQYFAGQQHVDNLEFEEAEKAFENAITLDSTFALAHYRLAYVQWWRHKSEEVQRSQLGNALALIDRLPERFRYLLRAQSAVLEEGFDSGIAVLNDMKEVYPDDKEMIYNLGDYSFHANRYDEAAVYFGQVLEVNPDDERALNHLTITYIAVNDKPKAVAVAKRYVDASGSDEAYLALTDAHLIDGDTDGAFEAVTDAMQALPNSALIRHRYATVQYMRDRFDVARSILDSLVANNQSERVLRLGYRSLVDANLYMGRYREALDHIERWMTLAFYDPEREDSVTAVLQHQKKGLIYLWGWNDTEHADTEFKKAVEIKGQLRPEAFGRKQSREYYMNLTVFYLINGRLDLAQEIAEQELEDDREYSDRVRFFTHWKDREYDQAQTVADTLLARVDEGQKTLIWYYLAQSQMADGQPDEAIASLEDLRADCHTTGARAILYAPSHFLLGKAYEQKGDTRHAIENYEKFLEFWEEADSDLVLRQEASIRLADLRSSTTRHLRSSETRN